MENLNINSYLGKSTGDQITASMWNELFAEIQDKINEIVAQVSGTTPGGDEPTPGPGTGGDEPTPQGEGFFVNGVKQTSNVITLPAGASYKLSGKLEGQVIIDAESAKPLGNTNVVLDNVEIVSNENYAIKYTTPQSNKGYKDLVITLAKDSKNYVVCTKSVAIEDDQPGAIYSMNNLVIQGVGALAISNNGGHGVRATEVNIIGPYMYIQATHDGIHGKKIKAIYGQFKFNNVKDGFGTGKDGSFFGGKINCQFENIRGSEYHIKGNSIFRRGEDYYTSFVDEDGNSIISNASSYHYEIGQVTVAADKDSDPTIITKNENNEYIIPDNLPYVTVTGSIGGNIVVPETFTNGVDSAVTINLENAYISGGITFNPTSDNVKIVSKKDTINMIINYSGNTIKSENNIKLELKNNSVLYVTSKFDGIDGGDVTITDSKGVLLVTDCGERGIKGNAIVIGPSAEITKSVITSYVTDPASLDYTDFEGAVIVVDNCKDVLESFIDGTSEETAKSTGYADIFARQGKKVTKGVFGTRDAQLNGPLIVGSIGATIGCDFDNARMLYYDRLIEGTNVTNDPGTISPETGMTEFVHAITINPIDNSQQGGDNTGGEQGGTEEQTPTERNIVSGFYCDSPQWSWVRNSEKHTVGENVRDQLLSVYDELVGWAAEMFPTGNSKMIDGVAYEVKPNTFVVNIYDQNTFVNCYDTLHDDVLVIPMPDWDVIVKCVCTLTPKPKHDVKVTVNVGSGVASTVYENTTLYAVGQPVTIDVPQYVLEHSSYDWDVLYSLGSSTPLFNDNNTVMFIMPDYDDCLITWFATRTDGAYSKLSSYYHVCLIQTHVYDYDLQMLNEYNPVNTTLTFLDANNNEVPLSEEMVYITDHKANTFDLVAVTENPYTVTKLPTLEMNEDKHELFINPNSGITKVIVTNAKNIDLQTPQLGFNNYDTEHVTVVSEEKIATVREIFESVNGDETTLSSIKVGYNVPGPFSVQRSISSIYNLVYPDGDPLGGGLTVWVKANYQNQDTFDTIREVQTSEITNSNLDMIGLTTQNIPTWNVDIRYEAGMKVSTE